MFKHKIQFIFAIAFFLSFPGAQGADLKIGSSHPIVKGYFGSNIENAFSGSGRYLWTDPETLSAVQALNLQSLRFPGGAAANFWDWKAGTGYPNFPTARDSRNDTLAVFAPLSKATGGPPVFVLNVMTYQNALGNAAQAHAMAQKQIAMLNAAKNLGLPIQYLELGNEFYLSEKHYPERFPTGEAYAAEMSVWVHDLKAAFPDAKIALVGDYATKWRPWNSSLLPKLPPADAVTIHRYDNVNSGDPVALLANVFKDWDSFEKNAISLFSGRGLSVWMTEFDMSDKTKDHSLASTWLHGIYDAEMMVQYLSEPAVTQVDIYNFHSDNINCPLIYTGHEVFGPGQIKTQAGALSASGQVMSIFGKAIKEASSVAPIDLSAYGTVSPDGSHSGFTAYPALTGVAFGYGKGSAPSGLMIVNLSANPVSLHYGSGKAAMDTLSAANLSANVVTQSSLNSTHLQVALENFSVPAYSVNYLKK